VKGENYDSFKFVMEKNVDFHEIDVELFLKAYEEAFKPKMAPIGMGADAKNSPSEKPKAFKNMTGWTAEPEAQQQANPQTTLESLGCSVFVPGVRKEQLDWEYLAGYDSVKRDIEDTVLLALTHAEVYDQITSRT
jgi:hypothetical protein